MELIYQFKTEIKPELSHVGGKGMSLILMTREGLPVPSGFVLSVAFFEPWLKLIKESPEWAQVLKSTPEELKKNCDMVKALCEGLELDDAQKKVLSQAMEALKIDVETALFAVRSSSPEEDLEGASFAGGYETILGVKEENIKDALRRSFASCLDERVFLYKKEHGFAVDEPKIAVIVQEQIASETSGVAFSLNPLNNCYDEAVINANFGLGESVVSGLVSPDTFIVDKVSGKVLEKKTGTKESSIWLSPNGGTTEDTSKRGDTLSLTDEDLQRLTDMLVKVEDYYNRPIDIEWAFSDGRLYLLQARPITAYIPLPEEMITEPGEQKRLYLDVTLSKQGIQEPMSHMGIDYLSSIQTRLFRELLGTTGLMGVDKLYFSCEGRMYGNILNSYKIMGKKRTLNDWRTQDAIAADILENMDEKEYVPKKSPRGLLGLKIKIFLSGLGIFRKLREAYKDPVSYKNWYFKETERYMKDLDEIKKMDIPPKEIAKRTIERFVTFLVDVSLPMTYAAEYARPKIRKIFRGESEEIKEMVVFLERALPENITLEMGLEMYKLSEFSEASECTSGEEFERKISERSFSQEFLEAYDSFMEKYGFRCPRELDLATPRTYENPAEFFKQLHAMSLNKDEETNPQLIFEKSAREREEAFNELMAVAGKRGRRKARGLKKNYDVLVEFGGYREIHKYYFIMIIDLF
ncbi:MAG: PEP/pyruvate-binding domain-containing protein, partial [Halobacteriota archaeon]|nr:PEP/pyruvate-binding domain-containing protein [Halobacteriota archaeon]